jgi:hypothetical protein
MGDVRVLALVPWLFRNGVAVRAVFDDVEDGRTELLEDQPPDAVGAEVLRRVLDGVVQQGRDRLVFGGPEIEGQRRHAEQVRHVRRTVPLPPLSGVQFCGKHEGFGEAAADLAAFVGNEGSGKRHPARADNSVTVAAIIKGSCSSRGD